MGKQQNKLKEVIGTGEWVQGDFVPRFIIFVFLCMKHVQGKFHQKGVQSS